MSSVEKPPSASSGLNAAAGAARVGAGAGRVAAQAPVSAATIQARAIAKGTATIVEALASFAARRSTTVIPALQASLSAEFVERTPEQIARLLSQENARERTFLRRQRSRMLRDLPQVLREADHAKRQERLDKLLARERHYMRLREQALTARAHTAVEMLDIQEASPEGAYWLLSESARNHTPGCVAMSNQFWPWRVLHEVMHPPVHPGCPCWLVTLDEAVARGLMRGSALPSVNDAMTRARSNAALEEALFDEFGEDVVMDAMLGIEEARPVRDAGRTAAKIVPKRYAKGFEHGGEFMPKFGGSPGARIQHLVRARHHESGRSLGTRKVWMKGNHVSVPGDKAFDRHVGGAHFTSPPGGTNVYRNGKLVSTPEHPALHPDMERPRGSAKRGAVGAKGDGASAKVDTAKKKSGDGQLLKVERALRGAKAETPPVHEGDSGQRAHAALAKGGFTADEANATETATTLSIPYKHADGHELTVEIDRATGKVSKVAWTPGSEPSDTSKLRKRLGMDTPKPAGEKPSPKPSAEPKHEARPKPTEVAHEAHESMLARTLGTGDARWGEQLDRAVHEDSPDAQWDLAQELRARGPNSEFARRLTAEVGAAKVKRWQRDSAFPRDIPDSPPGPRYAVKRVHADAHGPAVGVAIGQPMSGDQGTGHYFVSRPGEGHGEGDGIDLSGAHLVRPRDEGHGRSIANALSVVNGIADGDGHTVRQRDEQGVMRVRTLDDALRDLPGGHSDDARLLAEHAIEVRRGGHDEVAATHLMRGLGFDGVDNRHIPALDHEGHGSVVYVPVVNNPAHVANTQASERQGGSMLRGHMGRYVWIRGTCMHVRQNEDWRKVKDGVVFFSPAGGTDVYRKLESDTSDGHGELVSAPGMRQTHPDVRNPRLARNRRGDNGNEPAPPPAPDAPPPPVDPTPLPPEAEVAPPPSPPSSEPRPDFAIGDAVSAVNQRGASVSGSVHMMWQDEHGKWYVMILHGDTTSVVRAEGVSRTHLPEGAGLLLSDDHRAGLLANDGWAGAPGMSFNENQAEPLNATGLPEGQLVVGALWARMQPRERQLALDHAYGRALADAISRDESARGELSGLWTGGKFTSEDGHHLDRYSADAAVAAAFARMGGDDWQGFAANYPDVSRWVAGQAEQRNHFVRPDVREWLHNGEENGNVHDHAEPLPNDARALAQSLVGMRTNEITDRLRGEGYLPSAREGGGPYVVYRKIDAENHRVLTISIKVGDAFKAESADGSAYGFNPDTEPPEGNTPERLAYELRGTSNRTATARLKGEGYLALTTQYTTSGSMTVYARPDSDVALHVNHSHTGAIDARPTMLTGPEFDQRMGLVAQEHPEQAFPAGTQLGIAIAALRGSGWNVSQISGEDSNGFRYVDLTRVEERDQSDTAHELAWRMKIGPLNGIIEVGKRGVSGEGMAIDDADARTWEAARNAGLRQEASQRTERLAAMLERSRTELNAGRNPFTAADSMLDIAITLRALGYTQGNGRTWRGDGVSETWKNRRLGAQVILRVTRNASAPDARSYSRPSATRAEGGEPLYTFAGAVVTAGEPDLGRNRTEPGRMPQTISAFGADALGFADELAARYGTRTNATEIEWASRRHGDHCGEWKPIGDRSGDAQLIMGRQIKPDLLEAAQRQRDGVEMTDRQRFRVWLSYHTAAHEIVHSVGVPGSLGSMGGYSSRSGSQGVEEALTEELSNQLTIEWLQRHGHDDVVEWARRDWAGGSPLHLTGTYQGFRKRFGQITGRMGFQNQAELRAAMEDWSYRKDYRGRINNMAERIAAHEGISLEAAREQVMAATSATHRTGNTPVTGFRPLLDMSFDLPGATPPAAEHDPSLPLPSGTRVTWRATNGNTYTGAIVNSDDAGNFYRVQPDTGRELTIRADQITSHPAPSDTAPPALEARSVGSRISWSNGATVASGEITAVTPEYGVNHADGPINFYYAVRPDSGGTLLTIRHDEALPGDPPAPLAAEGPNPDNATGTPYAIGSTMTGYPNNRNESVTGRVTEQEMSYSMMDSSVPVGWTYRIVTDSGHEHWIDHSQATTVTPPSAAPPPPPPPPPTTPSGPTVTLSDGGKVSVGAAMRGNSTGQLCFVTGIDGNQLSFTRQNGSTGAYGGEQFSSVAINSSGEVFGVGDQVSVDGTRPITIASIDWSDSRAPIVTLSNGNHIESGFLQRWTENGPVDFALPLTRRDGTSQNATVGTMVRLRDGRTARLASVMLQNWPQGTPMYRVEPEGGGLPETVRREDIVAFAHELPRPPQWSASDAAMPGADTLIRDLQTAHFERRDGGDAATRLGSWLGAHVGSDFAGWAEAQRIDLQGASGAGTVRDVYSNAFGSQQQYEALRERHQRELDAVMQMAREAGLPTPNWEAPPAPGPPPGEVMDGPLIDEAVARSIYNGQFGHGGLHAEVHTTIPSSRGLSIQGYIKTGNGQQVGTFTRRVTQNADGSYGVYNAYLQIYDSHQGSGFASAFNKHCFDAYAQKGVREVTVSANIDVGGYTWAATGFDFAVPSNLASPRAKAESRARQAYTLALTHRSKLSDEEWRAILPKLWDGRGELRQDHVQHAWELAYIDGKPSGRRGNYNAGQKMLLGTSWSGVRLIGAAPPPREGAAALGEIPGGRPGGQPESGGSDAIPMPVRTLTASRSQRWLGHDIHAMSLSFRNGVREVATAMQRAHPDVRMRPPRLRTGTLPDPGPAAELDLESRRITLDTERALADRELITAQQYGTYLYERALADAGSDTSSPFHVHHRELMGELARSRAITDIQSMERTGRITRDEFLALTSYRAAFGRAYAQWLTDKSGNSRMRRQLRRVQRDRVNGRGMVWADRDFTRIAPLMDSLFTAMTEQARAGNTTLSGM